MGFAVPKAANDAAQALWGQTADGKGVAWTTSYGASGDQSRAVVAGLAADYVVFSVGSDMTRLVDAGLVAKDWDAGPTKGIVSDSVVVLVVRKGNPKNIQGWDDIIKPGVGIVTPNPGSSGSARWNILAAWSHVVANGGTEAQATDFLTKVFQGAVALPGSGRDATTAFQGGTGDVLLSYENEAILARQNGADFDYIVPDTTLKIENPGAVTVGSQPEGQELPRLRPERRRPEGLRLEGVPTARPEHQGRRAGRERPGEPLPDPGEADRRSTVTSGAGRPRPRSSSTRTTGSSPRSSRRPASS